MFKLLLTALSFFRATSPKFAPVKTSTITGPFTGSSEVLPEQLLKRALRSLGVINYRGPRTIRACFAPMLLDYVESAY